MSAQTKSRRNQFGETVQGEDKYLTLQNWETVWKEGKTKFHMERVHPMLIKHFSKIVGGRLAPLSIFLPLSGKSMDLKWLADQGHKVIGNEISLMACEQFFEENKLDYETFEIEGTKGKCVKSSDNQCDVTLYCCDFFCLTSNIVGHLDGVWDRGSFAAISQTDRQRYSQTMKSLLSEDTRYLLDVFSMDHTVFAGPPFSTTEDELKQLYADCSIEQVDKKDAVTDWQRTWGLTEFIETDYLIIKNS